MTASKSILSTKNKYQTFFTISGLEKFIRKNGTPDNFKLRGMIFTQEEYDYSGKEVYYGNVKHSLTISVSTFNRYDKNLKFKDAQVELYPMVSYRNDIHYIE